MIAVFILVLLIIFSVYIVLQLREALKLHITRQEYEKNLNVESKAWRDKTLTRIDSNIESVKKTKDEITSIIAEQNIYRNYTELLYSEMNEIMQQLFDEPFDFTFETEDGIEKLNEKFRVEITEGKLKYDVFQINKIILFLLSYFVLNQLARKEKVKIKNLYHKVGMTLTADDAKFDSLFKTFNVSVNGNENTKYNEVKAVLKRELRKLRLYPNAIESLVEIIPDLSIYDISLKEIKNARKKIAVEIYKKDMQEEDAVNLGILSKDIKKEAEETIALVKSRIDRITLEVNKEMPSILITIKEIDKTLDRRIKTNIEISKVASEFDMSVQKIKNIGNKYWESLKFFKKQNYFIYDIENVKMLQEFIIKMGFYCEEGEIIETSEGILSVTEKMIDVMIMINQTNYLEINQLTKRVQDEYSNLLSSTSKTIRWFYILQVLDRTTYFKDFEEIYSKLQTKQIDIKRGFMVPLSCVDKLFGDKVINKPEGFLIMSKALTEYKLGEQNG